jgi:predicted RNase H-like nuclease (RuvC/YqgF family)
MLKNIIANLESEFVTYKIDANTKLEELYKTLEKKDNEIAMLKQEITNLKTTNDNQQQTLGDLSLKQLGRLLCHAIVQFRSAPRGTK